MVPDWHTGSKLCFRFVLTNQIFKILPMVHRTMVEFPVPKGCEKTTSDDLVKMKNLLKGILLRRIQHAIRDRFHGFG